MDNLNIGDSVKWVSAAGVLTGKISNISLDKNAANDLVPWILVQVNNQQVNLCGTLHNFQMLKLKKI